jgi:uncharacterized membrane protein YhaH (DUF805 family)
MRTLAVVTKGVRRTFDFHGRTSQGDYWRLVAVLIPLGLILQGVLPKGPVLTALLICVVLPLFSAGVRRMHDVGQSGWATLWGMVPIVGPLMTLNWTASRGTPAVNRFGPPPGSEAGSTHELPVQVHRRTYLDADGRVTGHAYVDDLGNIVSEE